LLLPTWLSLLIVLVHAVCVLIKATDEESYLLTAHGDEYRAYRSRTGRLFPKWPAGP
jgi:protein-S-isoprenylcysteine O-methyltransferase Ste14